MKTMAQTLPELKVGTLVWIVHRNPRARDPSPLQVGIVDVGDDDVKVDRPNLDHKGRARIPAIELYTCPDLCQQACNKA